MTASPVTLTTTVTKTNSQTVVATETTAIVLTDISTDIQFSTEISVSIETETVTVGSDNIFIRRDAGCSNTTSTTSPTIPTYASDCSSAAAYSSACSCIGVTPFTVWTTPCTLTATVVITSNLTVATSTVESIFTSQTTLITSITETITISSVSATTVVIDENSTTVPICGPTPTFTFQQILGDVSGQFSPYDSPSSSYPWAYVAPPFYATPGQQIEVLWFTTDEMQAEIFTIDRLGHMISSNGTIATTNGYNEENDVLIPLNFVSPEMFVEQDQANITCVIAGGLTSSAGWLFCTVPGFYYEFQVCNDMSLSGPTFPSYYLSSAYGDCTTVPFWATCV